MPKLIAKIELQFGPTPTEGPLYLHPGPMTIFVGPNNSGKSLVLREIDQLLTPTRSPQPFIVHRLLARLPSLESMKGLLLRKEVPSQHGLPPKGYITITLGKPGSANKTEMFDFDDFVKSYENFRTADVIELTQATKEAARKTLFEALSYLVLLLDGRTRLALTDPAPAGDLLAAPANHLAALLHDEAARARLRDITSNALGLFFTIDPTAMSHLRVRMAKRAPSDPDEELGLSERARTFHQSASLVQEMSDGVKAFTGISAAVLSGDYQIFLIDEPEAFLHPPLGHKLGQLVTTLAAENDNQVIAATHSPFFLMGCVDAGKPVDVVRLTYENGVAQARLLPAPTVQLLMRDPLLRSTDVLNALFHRGAVVCEADRDRAFYSEINQRLLQHTSHGAKDSIFLNAQNAQTIRRIIMPLRNLGIPAAAVVDLDIITDGNGFKELCKAALIPSPLVHAWGTLRGNIEATFRNTKADLKTGGVANLAQPDREAAQSLLNGMASYGVFIVAVGEVEDWLTHLQVPKSGKSQWLTKIFEEMQSDPEAPGYLRPDTNDVWEFLRQIAEWISDPRRKGMPE